MMTPEEQNAIAAQEVKAEVAELLRHGYVLDEFGAPPPGTGQAGPELDGTGWLPPLSEAGQKLWNCEKKYILLHGERAGAKTSDALSFLLKHAYQNDGATVCITTKERSGLSDGGPWGKLQEYVLPAWQDGYTNWDGTFYKGFKLRGEGKNGEILYHTDNSKNLWFWIVNQHGNMSKVFTRSLQHAEQVLAKIRTVEFTAYYHEELTLVDSEDYFLKPIQQLFRKSGNFPRFFLAACNPPEEGEDHWVYQRFFTGMDEPASVKNPNPKKSSEYETIHFPVTGNIFMSPELKAANWAGIMEEARNDPTAEDRLIKGLWRKKPTGKGIFKGYWNRDLHLAGKWVADKPQESILIVPDPKRIIEVGYDPGPVNFAICFGQKRMGPHGEGWIVFDEICLVGGHVPIAQVAVKLLDQMNYWCQRCNTRFMFNHISDKAAHSQHNSEGNTDAKLLTEVICGSLDDPNKPPGLLLGPNKGKWPMLTHLVVPTSNGLRVNYRIIACPKSAGSVAGRVKMTVTRLQMRLLKVSAKCLKTVEMFESLDRDKEVFQPKDGPQKHPFDAMSYPMWHHELGGETYNHLALGTSAEFVGVG